MEKQRSNKVQINIVIFDGEYQKIKDYLDSVTGKPPVKVIVIKNDLSHIYAISEALKNNELVCMHADRFVEGSKTISCNFFGEPARFPAGPFVLAATFKVPVSFVFAFKETSTHYHFFASDPIHVKRTRDPKQTELAVQELLKKYLEEVEKNGLPLSGAMVQLLCFLERAGRIRFILFYFICNFTTPIIFHGKTESI